MEETRVADDYIPTSECASCVGKEMRFRPEAGFIDAMVRSLVIWRGCYTINLNDRVYFSDARPLSTTAYHLWHWTFAVMDDDGSLFLRVSE